jgi:hypothetical protein
LKTFLTAQSQSLPVHSADTASEKETSINEGISFTDKIEFIIKFSKKAGEIAENLILSEAKEFCEEMLEFNYSKNSLLIKHFITELLDGIEKFKLEKVKSILKKIENMEKRND